MRGHLGFAHSRVHDTQQNTRNGAGAWCLKSVQEMEEASEGTQLELQELPRRRSTMKRVTDVGDGELPGEGL